MNKEEVQKEIDKLKAEVGMPDGPPPSKESVLAAIQEALEQTENCDLSDELLQEVREFLAQAKDTIENHR